MAESVDIDEERFKRLMHELGRLHYKLNRLLKKCGIDDPDEPEDYIGEDIRASR